MITPYKDRSVDNLKPVEFYRCLTRRGRVFSIRQSGKVVGHCEEVTLKDCELIVNKKASERVKQTKERYVHAFIKGYVTNEYPERLYSKVGYNPYIDYSFRDREGDRQTAKFISLNKEGLYISRY